MTTVQENDFAVGNAQFAAEAYNHVATAKSGNFLFCPLSVEIILALIHTGANGETARQLSTGLHLPNNSEEIQHIFKKLTSQLHSNKDYILSSANKIYVKNDYTIKDGFKKTATNIFNAEVATINFQKKEEAASEMNKWVENKTRDKIKNLISSDQLDKLTRTVLVNAVYFCGKWEKVFSKYLSNKSPFHLNHNNTVQVDMMRQKDYFRYYESSELDATFLEMPYEGGDVTIHFVLPKEKEGLSKLESRVSDIFATPQYSYYNVLVMIPKFETETAIEFKPILEALGIVDPFEDNADFSGIVLHEPTKINSVIQKAFIAVDEEGTTAAAAIDCILELPEDSYVIEPAPPPAEFIADHPFLFYIKFKDVVLFVGRFSSVAD